MSNSTNGWSIMYSNIGLYRRHKVLTLVGFSALIFLSLANFSATLPLDEFYPFSITDDNKTEELDDGGSPRIVLNVDFPFFNVNNYRDIFVNNNGIISFLEHLKSYKPLNFDNVKFENAPPLVVPFWADVDIQHINGQNATIVYRISYETDVLNRASRDVKLYFDESTNFTAEVVIIVTWYNVGFYGASDVGRNKRNTFQAVLMTDQRQSYAIFNYNKTTWTTGSNSGGDTKNGTGGKAAVVGFYAAKDKYFLLNNSQTDEIINISFGSNIKIAGKYMFRIDGVKVDERRCLLSNISISPSSISMLGQEAVKISGPCLSPGQSVKARIRELNLEFPCDVDVSLTASCVIPSLFKTGDFSFDFNTYGESWIYSTTISSLHLLNMAVKLTRYPPQLWQLGEFVTVQWESSMAPSQLNKGLELLAYTEDSSGGPYFTLLQQLDVTAGVTSRKFRLLSSLEIGNNTLVMRLCWRSDLPNIYPICIWSDVFSVKWNSTKESEMWCQNWLTKEKTLERIVISAPFCPCTASIIRNDLCHFHLDPICDRSKTTGNTNCLYNPYAYQCFRRNIKSGESTGETCCYNEKGNLMDIRENSGAGTHERFHYRAQGNTIVPYFSYFQSDILPKLHCCQLSDKNCSDYIYFRNATTCQHYLPPSPAQAAGDPHLVTLDGKDYSFNGVGDFYLVTDEQSSLAIQVHAERAVDNNGHSQNATVFSNIAVAMLDTSDIIEIRKTVAGSEVLHNHQIIVPEPSTSSEFRNISLITYSNESYNIVLMAVGISVSVEVTPYLLNILVLIGEADLKGRIRGLLGNYNGNDSDDFLSRNGTMLPPSSRMRDIHNIFGMSWQVPAKESLFSDVGNQMSESSIHEPIFIDELPIELVNNTVEICGTNKQCMFDYQVTRIEAIASSYAVFSTKFDTLKEDLLQKVVQCEWISPPENGNKTSSERSPGSVVKFTCNPGYELLQGSSERVCMLNGMWNGSDIVCAAKVPVVTNNGSKTLLIVGSTAGIGGVLVIIVILVVVCCIRWWKRKNVTHTEDVQFELTETIRSPMFENPAFLQGLHKLIKDGRFQIPRPEFVDPSLFEEYF